MADVTLIYLTTPIASVVLNQGPAGSDGAAGASDHGALTGLSDDDHTAYHTDARGDARYYTQGQLDTSLAAKLAHTTGTLTDVRETRYNEGSVSGSQEINAANGNRQEFTMTGNVTGQSFAGFTSGVAQTVEVWWISNGNTMAWDASIDWGTAGAPTTPPDGEKLRTWFETVDGATTVYGRSADGYTE